MRPKRRSTRRRTRCNDRLIPSPVRRLLNEPRRRIDAAKCEPNIPDSRSGGEWSFDAPRNHRTIPPKRLTEFRSELDPESGKNVRSLCLGVSAGWLITFRFMFDTGLWLSPACSSWLSASSKLCWRYKSWWQWANGEGFEWNAQHLLHTLTMHFSFWKIIFAELSSLPAEYWMFRCVVYAWSVGNVQIQSINFCGVQ